ncbi:hypothetical protein BD410DRAFT_782982 [Rickenella mellea]|uniref:F-box domain-containing protein n=1 Tax=Rickenella mellea TaxID=50990 RepID=A0A4Y7QI02_9AGAM|nr:hypothetical protein BD410DRAFT_782982 [Rickenella mellea]
MESSSNSTISPALASFPDEILLLLMGVSEIPAILAMRLTCRRLCIITQDLTLWTNIAKYQFASYPMGRIERTNKWLFSQDLNSLENLTIRAYRLHEAWLQPREAPLLHLTKIHKDFSIVSMDVFNDRWLVTSSQSGTFSLSDLKASNGDYLCGDLSLNPLFASTWFACVTRLSNSGEYVTLVATCNDPLSTTAVIVFALERHSQPACVSLLALFEAPFPSRIRDVGTGSAATVAMFSRSSKVDIYDWRSKARTTLQTQEDELDESLWNGVIAVRLCGRYLLCVKCESIELYACPPFRATTELIHAQEQTDHEKPLGLHRFSDRRFHDASFSEYREADGTITILLLDVLHGLYLYRVRIEPHFRLFPLGKFLLGPDKGFVSTFTLGPEGKRGIWVERWRANTQRTVYAFSTPLRPYDDPEDGDTVNLTAIPVYAVKSYDLRDDLTTCALSEPSGRIILGTRDGRIQVLDCLPASDRAG